MGEQTVQTLVVGLEQVIAALQVSIGKCPSDNERHNSHDDRGADSSIKPPVILDPSLFFPFSTLVKSGEVGVGQVAHIIVP